ncbi:MAG TPA: ATP-binding protein, partial [Verrucomicrobiae bacterium]
AVENANALLHVINDVLDFSKIEAGKMTVAVEEFSLRNVVDSVLENVTGRATAKKIAVAAVVHREIPQRVMGDASRLRQVLLNLVGNGVKFTDCGEVVVRVHMLFQNAEKIVVRFEVEDTGIGMTNADLQKLFQPFEQADNSSSRKFGGTGLGLAISRRLVDLMGGRIGVKSALGKGSTFWFELPFLVPPQPLNECFFPGLVFLHAVVAVANSSQRQALLEQLQGWGVLCQPATTPANLIRTGQNELVSATIPLIVVDDEMLAQGGEELGKSLRENQERVQYILLTNPAGSLATNQAGPARWVQTLLKPVREQPLFGALVAAATGDQPKTSEEAKGVAGTATTPAPPPPAAAKRTPISDLRILVAEDHPFNRKLCQLMLENVGAHADWAVNGREAVQKFSSGNYEAILMDCNMPELDGFAATAAIRKLEANRPAQSRVRIIALTANALAGERERCLAAGMDDYVAKPFTAQQLYQALLGAAPAQPAAPPPLSASNFDPGPLQKLCDELERNAVIDMVSDFLKEFPDRLEQLHRLQRNSAWPELERSAHSLKGLARLFGFNELPDLFLAIEDAAEMADAARVETAFAALAGKTEPAAAQLRAWLDQARQQR